MRAPNTAILIACAAANMAAAQAIVVSGVVHSDSKAGPGVRNAEVSIVPGPNPVRTDSAGQFRLIIPGAGPSLLNVRAVGFTKLESTVEIDGPDSSRIDIVLHPATTVLAPVEVKGDRVEYISPALRGFEDRRRAGIGRFVSEATLRQNDNRQFAEVLASRVPGARVISFGSRTFLGSTRTAKNGKTLVGGSGRYCYASIYVDGVLRYDMSIAPGMGPPDLSEFAVDHLGGVEYYPGEATPPAGYRHSGCGLLLLWTRER
jgi:hypothetical protein